MRKTTRYVTHRARTWAAMFIAMIAATALLAQPAWATTPAEGSGTFTFAAAVTSSRQADGNTFLTLTGTEAIAGAIPAIALTVPVIALASMTASNGRNHGRLLLPRWSRLT